MSKNKYSKENIRKFLSNASWTYKEMFRLAPRDVSLILLTLLTVASLPTLMAFLAAKMVDETIDLVSKGFTISDLTMSSDIVLLVIAMASIVIVQSAIRSYRNFLDQKFKTLHLNRYTDMLYAKIASLDIQSFENKKISNSIQKAKDNLWKVRDFVLTSFSLVTEMFGMGISAVIIFRLSPMLFLFLTIVTLPGSIFFVQFIIAWWKFYDDNTEDFRTRWWIFGNITHENNAQENRVSKADNVLTEMVEKIGNKVYNGEVAIRLKWLKKELLTNILYFAQNLFTPLYLLAKLLNGDFSIGDLSFYSGRSGEYTNRLDSVLGLVVDIFDASIGVEHVRSIMERQNIIIGGRRKLDLRKPPAIEFKNVSFKYPDTKKYSLKNVSLAIKPGEEVAIVGENGAGKTTFIKLLLRFYDATSGEILINGRPIQEYNLNEYHKAIGVLFQEYNIYHFLSIKENVTIGRETSKGDINLEKALKLADAHKFIGDLEKKTEHKMSKQFKDGVSLSTGQEQKVALARMFYRNAPVLILDEPTASIDAVAEHKIFKRIYQFMTKKTVIIISHRFSTVRNAQKIYVFNKGEVKEYGSHEELMNMKGKYHKAFSLQAKGYN